MKLVPTVPLIPPAALSTTIFVPSGVVPGATRTVPLEALMVPAVSAAAVDGSIGRLLDPLKVSDPVVGPSQSARLASRALCCGLPSAPSVVGRRATVALGAGGRGRPVVGARHAREDGIPPRRCGRGCCPGR